MDRQYQPMTTAPTYHQDEQHHQLHQLHHHHQQPSPAQLLPPYTSASPPLLLLQARHHLPPLQLELQQQQQEDPEPVLPVLSSVFPQLAPLNHRRTAVVQAARSRSGSGSRSRSRSPSQSNIAVVKREGDRSVAPYPQFANHSHSHGHSHSHSHLPSPVPAAATATAAGAAATTVIPGLALLDETDNDVKPEVTKLEEPGRDRDEKSASRKYGLSTPPEDNMTGAGGGGGGGNGGVPGALLGHTQYTYVGGIGAGQYGHGSLNGTTANGNGNGNVNVQGLGHGFGAAAAGFVKQENSDMNAPARLQTQRRQNQQQPQLQPQSRHWKLSHLTSELTCLFWFETIYKLDAIENLSAYDYNYNPPPLRRLAVPTHAFKDWVHTVLQTTRVSSNVILLALLYVYRFKRMTMVIGQLTGSEERVLAVALMMANKYLDDNTYTTQTWGDVCGMSVRDLHTMEMEFLNECKYNLFVRHTQWAEWQKKIYMFRDYLRKAMVLPFEGEALPINMPLQHGNTLASIAPSIPTPVTAGPQQQQQQQQQPASANVAASIGINSSIPTLPPITPLEAHAPITPQTAGQTAGARHASPANAHANANVNANVNALPNYVLPHGLPASSAPVAPPASFMRAVAAVDGGGPQNALSYSLVQPPAIETAAAQPLAQPQTQPQTQIQNPRKRHGLSEQPLSTAPPSKRIATAQPSAAGSPPNAPPMYPLTSGPPAECLPSLSALPAFETLTGQARPVQMRWPLQDKVPQISLPAPAGAGPGAAKVEGCEYGAVGGGYQVQGRSQGQGQGQRPGSRGIPPDGKPLSTSGVASTLLQPSWQSSAAQGQQQLGYTPNEQRSTRGSSVDVKKGTTLFASASPAPVPREALGADYALQQQQQQQPPAQTQTQTQTQKTSGNTRGRGYYVTSWQSPGEYIRQQREREQQEEQAQQEQAAQEQQEQQPMDGLAYEPQLLPVLSYPTYAAPSMTLAATVSATSLNAAAPAPAQAHVLGAPMQPPAYIPHTTARPTLAPPLNTNTRPSHSGLPPYNNTNIAFPIHHSTAALATPSLPTYHQPQTLLNPLPPLNALGQPAPLPALPRQYARALPLEQLQYQSLSKMGNQTRNGALPYVPPEGQGAEFSAVGSGSNASASASASGGLGVGFVLPPPLQQAQQQSQQQQQQQQQTFGNGFDMGF